MMQELGLKTTAELIQYAISLGIVVQNRKPPLSAGAPSGSRRRRAGLLAAGETVISSS
jgi:hypothetical protein